MLKAGKPLDFSYAALRVAILELYLSVKIRSDQEIDNYDESAFLREKDQLKDCDGYAIIDLIKNSVELLMHMRDEEQKKLMMTHA